MSKPIDSEEYEVRTEDIDSERSAEYTRLIDQLKDSIGRSVDIVSRIVEQALKDGIPNKVIYKSIIKQMNYADMKETCSLTRVFYYLLNEFLEQLDGEKHGENIIEIIDKCRDACMKMAHSKEK